MDKGIKDKMKQSLGYIVVTVNRDGTSTSHIRTKKGWKLKDVLELIHGLDKTSGRLWQEIEKQTGDRFLSKHNGIAKGVS